MNNELYHYGVKGMKWGIRRYQNKDGSLTNLGRKRRTGCSGYDIPNGTVVYRAVRNKSKSFMDRDYTYVNITDDYATHHMNTSEGFDGEFDTDYKMKTNRNLRIASTSDYFHAVMKSNNIDPNQYLKSIPNDVVDKGRYIIENGLLEYKYTDGMFGISKAFDNAVKYLQDNGYDGLIDPVDGAIQERNGETPVAAVIFNPKESLSIINEYDR